MMEVKMFIALCISGVVAGLLIFQQTKASQNTHLTFWKHVRIFGSLGILQALFIWYDLL
jgi:hypothetical protein